MLELTATRKEGLGGIDVLKTEFEPEMCAHSPKGKSYPGPHSH